MLRPLIFILASSLLTSAAAQTVNPPTQVSGDRPTRGEHLRWPASPSTTAQTRKWESNDLLMDREGQVSEVIISLAVFPVSRANGCSDEGEHDMRTLATYLRDHAHELSDLTQEYKDSAASNRLEHSLAGNRKGQAY
jgi:hypothetical protein